MGTSQSRRDGGPGRPLVPPWADKDPPVTPPGEPPAPVPAPGPAQPTADPPEVTTSGRLAGFRRALGQFAASGSRDDARRALGHYARTGAGGTRAGAQRMARAARTGGSALAAFGRAGAGLPPSDPAALDVRALAGAPVQTAIDRIVDAFCPPGILDEDLARAALGEALAETLAGTDIFDPAAITPHAVETATLAFAAELAFLQVAAETGGYLQSAPSPAAAVQRETELRGLIREVADVAGRPILAAASQLVTPETMTAVVSRLVEVVHEEMGRW